MNFNFNFDDPIKKEPAKAAEVVETTPFDADKSLAIAKKDQNFLAIVKRISEMRKQAVDLRITDDSTNQKAMEMLIQVKSLVKAADDAKKKVSIYVAAQKVKLGIDNMVLSDLKKPLESIDAIVRPKIGFYEKTQAELRRKIAAKQAEEAAAKAKADAEVAAKIEKDRLEKERQEAIDLQTKLNVEADAAGVERVSVPIPEVPDVVIPVIVSEVPVIQQSEKVSIGQGSAKVEGIWICTVINPDEVPRQYCSPNQKLLDEAIK